MEIPKALMVDNDSPMAMFVVAPDEFGSVMKSEIVGYTKVFETQYETEIKKERHLLFFTVERRIEKPVRRSVNMLILKSGAHIRTASPDDSIESIVASALSYQRRMRQVYASSVANSPKNDAVLKALDQIRTCIAACNETERKCMDRAAEAGEKALSALTAANAASEKSGEMVKVLLKTNEYISSLERKCESVKNDYAAKISKLVPWLRERLKREGRVLKRLEEVEKKGEEATEEIAAVGAQCIEQMGDMSHGTLDLAQKMMNAIEWSRTPASVADGGQTNLDNAESISKDAREDEPRCHDDSMQPSLFDAVDEADESKGDLVKPNDESVTDEVPSPSPSEPKTRVVVDDFRVAGIDKTRPDSFPLLMTNYGEAMYRLGKVERRPDTPSGTIHYNMLLWAIGFVDTDDEATIAWLRNQRATFSNMIARFITEKCGYKVIRGAKRIRYSDAVQVVRQLENLGCFAGDEGIANSVTIHQGPARKEWNAEPEVAAQ